MLFLSILTLFQFINAKRLKFTVEKYHISQHCKNPFPSKEDLELKIK